jgi:hypothetical protein
MSGITHALPCPMTDEARTLTRRDLLTTGIAATSLATSAAANAQSNS